jgi:hypothetical protein
MSHNAEPKIVTARYFISMTVTYEQHKPIAALLHALHHPSLSHTNTTETARGRQCAASVQITIFNKPTIMHTYTHKHIHKHTEHN